MPKKGQTTRPPSGPRRLEERKPNVMLIYSCVCVFNAIVYTICQHNSNCLPYHLGVSKD
jgi:hypothetical protein